MEKEDKSLRIKIMLKKKGITQRTLAQKLGMSPQSLSNRLNGDTPLDANLIVSLRPILGDEVMELLDQACPVFSEPQHSAGTRPHVDLYAAGGGNEVLDRHKDYRNYLKRMGEALKSMGGVTYDYRKARDGKHRVVAVRRITWPKLSPYWARHTWASIAYSIGVPIDVIGQAMGHSDRRVTEIYIAKDRSRVDEANRRVIDWVLYGIK